MSFRGSSSSIILNYKEKWHISLSLSLSLSLSSHLCCWLSSVTLLLYSFQESRLMTVTAVSNINNTKVREWWRCYDWGTKLQKIKKKKNTGTIRQNRLRKQTAAKIHVLMNQENSIKFCQTINLDTKITHQRKIHLKSNGLWLVKAQKSPTANKRPFIS